jgi:3-hydroxybutyryl-CoA dehydrogenase
MQTIDTIRTIGVLGSGVMGHGIALVAAQAGYNVQLYDVQLALLDRALGQLRKFLDASVEKGKMTSATRDEVLGRIQMITELGDLRAEFVLEAIPEKLELKQEVFRAVEDVLGPEAILATNTSSIPVTAIAAGLLHPKRLVGMHFFNPAPLMKLVEVIGGEDTNPLLLPLTAELATRMGKEPAFVRDTPGFIVNRVARFFYLETLRAVEDGVADVHTADALFKARGFRMGPFELMDLIGVDTNHAVSQTVFQAFFQEGRFRPSRLQDKKVQAKHWGRKTNKGFYDYGA